MSVSSSFSVQFCLLTSSYRRHVTTSMTSTTTGLVMTTRTPHPFLSLGFEKALEERKEFETREKRVVFVEVK
jgi:hypothetical protein